jgi:hypothetical protein
VSRKKKNDDIFEHPFPTIESETIDISRLEDSMCRTIYTRPPYTITTTGTSGSDHFIVEPRYFDARDVLVGGIDTTTISGEWPSLSSIMSWEEYAKNMGKKEEAEVNLISKDMTGEHIVLCDTVLDLLPDRILTTLSAAKGKLMFTVAPIHIKEIRCRMTPDVRNNIIEASKRLKMYGKKSPIIPSFDEYGNRLPDQIEIGNNKGITVEIVDPQDYGRLYLELRAIEFPKYSSADWNFWSAYDEDVPF